VTWNGAAFDVPFLVDRYQAEHLFCPIKLRYDSTLRLKCPPLPCRAVDPAHLGRCSVIPEVLAQAVEALLLDAHFC
jgi:hypothetical protein